MMQGLFGSGFQRGHGMFASQRQQAVQRAGADGGSVFGTGRYTLYISMAQVLPISLYGTAYWGGNPGQGTVFSLAVSPVAPQLYITDAGVAVEPFVAPLA
jgi:hypothetical protein